VAYCEVNDLLVKDNGMMFSPTFDFMKFIVSAAEEMDGMMGEIYDLPLAGSAGGWTTLPLYQQLLLKQINVKLASGRILLTLQASGDTRALHAYGAKLIDEALAMLLPIINGDVVLETPGKNEEIRANSPISAHHDTESLVDAWEALVHRGENTLAMPGEYEKPEPIFRYQTPQDPAQEIPVPPFPVVMIGSDYQALLSDRYIDANATLQVITITLPTAVGELGRDYIIKRVNAGPNVVIVEGFGSETIDGELQYQLETQWESVTIISDNSNWKVI
jgi:hypothetical protein